MKRPIVNRNFHDIYDSNFPPRYFYTQIFHLHFTQFFNSAIYFRDVSSSLLDLCAMLTLLRKYASVDEFSHRYEIFHAYTSRTIRSHFTWLLNSSRIFRTFYISKGTQRISLSWYNSKDVTTTELALRF